MYKFSLREQNEKLKSDLELLPNKDGHQERAAFAKAQRRESPNNRIEQREFDAQEKTG